MNKLIFFLSILAIVSLLLTGCNSKGNLTDQPTPSSPAVTTPPSPPVSAPSTIPAAVPSASNIPGAGGSIWNIGGSSGSYFIAAVDAPSIFKSQANATCDGTADDVQWQAAIEAGYKNIVGSPGTFTFSRCVLVTNNNTVITAKGATFNLNNSTPVFSTLGNSGCEFHSFTSDQGGIDSSHSKNCTIDNIKVQQPTIPVYSSSKTYYVSNSTNHGYSVGNNSNDGLSKGAPFLTFDHAAGAVVLGDTIIINDGTFTVGAAYLYLYHGCNVVAETDYGATISFTGAATYGMLLSPNEAGNFTFGKVILEGADTAGSSFYLSAKAYTYSVVLNGTKIHSFSTVINPGSNTYANITMNGAIIDCQTTANNTTPLIYHQNLYGGLININGCTITHNTAGSTTQDTIRIARSASYTALVTAKISNNIITNSTATPAGGTNVIKVLDIPNAVIKGNTISTANKSGAGVMTSIGVGSGSGATINGDSPLIQDNIINSNATGGGIIVGVGIDNTVPDTTYGFKNNNAIIAGNNITGNTTSAAANIHGIMIGNENGGLVCNNRVSLVGIGLLAKGVTGGTYCYNLVTQALSYAFSRASTNTVFSNNTLVMSSGYATYGLQEDAYTGTNSTGITWKNNLVYSPVAVTSYLAYVDDTSTATFTNNLYYATSTYSFRYHGTTYATYTLWFANIETTGGVWSNPLFVNLASGDYNLATNSPAVNTGIAFTRKTDYNYNPITTNDIGAFSYTSSPSDISTGETKTLSGVISGVTPAGIMLALDNPFGKPVRVISIDLEMTTQGVASGTMCTGIGSSATADYETIFHILPCDPGTTYPYFRSSTKTTTYGVQTNPIYWESGSGNRYLNFYSHVANNGFVATYTITVMGN